MAGRRGAGGCCSFWLCWKQRVDMVVVGRYEVGPLDSSRIYGRDVLELLQMGLLWCEKG